MPRPQQVIAARPSIAAELRALFAELQKSEHNALERARDIGRRLLILPTTAERRTEWRASGIKRSWRSAQDYIRIAEHWDVVAQSSARSINAAIDILAEIKGVSKVRVNNYALRLDNVSSTDALARALASVRGRSVSIKVRVRQQATSKQEGQRRLPFE